MDSIGIIILASIAVGGIVYYYCKFRLLGKLKHEAEAIADRKKSLLADIEKLQAGKSDLEAKLQKLNAIADRIQDQVNHLGKELNDLAQHKSDLEQENAHLAREISKKKLLTGGSRVSTKMNRATTGR